MLSPTSLIPIRDENPTHSFPIFTIALMVINIVVFFLEPAFGTGSTCESAAFLYRWGMIPAEITSGDDLNAVLNCPGGASISIGGDGVYLSLLTSMFLHGGFMHLLGNMLFLWIFGNNVEDTLGKARFVVFYLICGLLAALAHAFTDPSSTIPTIGASGAIAGALGGYIVLFPKARVTTILPIGFLFLQPFQMPAVVVLGIWFASQFLIGQGQQPGSGGVAWMAHVGGFVAGAVLVVVLGGLSRRRSGLRYE